MRRKELKYIFLGLLVCLAFACSKVPSDLLSEKEMQRVMKDMLLAESMISSDYKSYEDNARKQALYEAVFRKHGITQAKYDSSLVWYGRNLDIYMKVYERVLADLNNEVRALGDIQADAAPVTNQDSIDIWPRRSYLAFTPQAVFNGVVFDIRPESDYSSGSSFVLGMNVWGMKEKAGHTPEIRLSADQGDTIVTVSDRIRRDGYHETILRTLPTKKVKRVYGYIRFDQAGSTGFRIYLDSLNLMKYRYGSDVLNPRKDTVP